VNPPLPGKGVGCGAGADASRPSLPCAPSGQEQPPVASYWLALAATAAASHVSWRAGAEHMAADRSDSTDKVWLVGACEVRFHFLPCGEWNAERAITLAPTRSREGEEGQGK
jgi:hypothetical protein